MRWLQGWLTTAKDAQSPRKFECLYGQKLRMAHFPLPFESFVWILTNRNMSNQNWNNLLSSSKFYLKANTGKMLTITPDGFLIPLSQRGAISNLTPGAERVQIDLRSISVIKTQGRRCSFWNKPILAQLNFVTNWSNNAIPKANGSGWQ